jgi:hypothetical protein
VADVIFAVDASSGRREGSCDHEAVQEQQEQQQEQAAEASASGAAMAQGEESTSMLYCTMDLMSGVPCPDGPDGVFYPNTKCCDYCRGPEAAANGCWPSDAADQGLFYMPRYGGGSLNHTLPRLPQRREAIEPLLGRITFFGCDSPERTSIVYLPNRLVNSGASGGPALKSIIDYQVPLMARSGRYSADSVEYAYRNGAAQVPGGDGDEVAADRFKTCLACLYLTKATRAQGADAFKMKRDCAECYDEYCYKGASKTPLAKRTRRMQHRGQKPRSTE